MGPSKTAVSEDAFTTQRYRNETRALQTQLQFNRNAPAVPENLAFRFSHPRPIIIEKLKASSDQRNPVGSEDPSLRSSGLFSVVSEERLKLAVQLAKRDVKQRRLKEQVKQQLFGDVVSTPLGKSQQQKTEVFASQENKNALKSQTRLTCQQRLNQGASASSDANVCLCVVKEGKPIPAVLDSPPTHDTAPDPKPHLNKKEHQNMQEVQRLQKELRSYVQKIEEIIKKGVKEIQGDLEKLSPHTIKHTKKSRAVSRLAAAHRGAVRTLQAFANQFTDQRDEQIPAHYKELGSLIRQLSLCSAKLEGDSSISEIIIDILLQVEQAATNADILSEKLLDDLLEDTAQELWSMDQHERLQTEALPVADTHSLESMLQRMEEIEMYQEAVRRRVTQIVYSDSQFWPQEDKMELQMASRAEKLTSPHPVQITKLIRHTELEKDILFEKPFDSTDIDENKEAEEKLQTGNDIVQPLPLNSLQKVYSVSLSVPSDVLQSILDYNSRYRHHLKLISHEAVGSFDPWQIAESVSEQLTEEALCDVAAELQDVCEDYAEAVFTSEFLKPVQ
ncbi:hypothetical protein TURU_104355 [Turdus rufiventris]|nr:hypothetical protein TURU_104355 [Turdus rufiventris]